MRCGIGCAEVSKGSLSGDRVAQPRVGHFVRQRAGPLKRAAGRVRALLRERHDAAQHCVGDAAVAEVDHLMRREQRVGMRAREARLAEHRVLRGAAVALHLSWHIYRASRKKFFL